MLLPVIFRTLRRVLCAAVAIAAALLAGPRLEPASAQAPAPAVRLALVNVPDDIVRPLLPAFQAESGMSAAIVYTGRDPFGVARDGKADLVIAHYGHEEVEPFVTGGHGLWPRAVFANQMALLGPPDDPAKVRGLTDPAEALRRIAATRSRYVVNNSVGAKYLEDIMAIRAGTERSGDWYLDKKMEGPAAARVAAQQGAYVLWGVPPFLRLKGEEKVNLEALVVGAPLFQRVMVSIAANPAKVAGVNAAGARAFERFLISPKTQAWIEAFRYPGLPQQVWWAAGRHNSPRD